MVESVASQYLYLTEPLANSLLPQLIIEFIIGKEIEVIVTVEPSANAVPELLDPPDELSIALLQTERTIANVYTSNSDQKRFFQD